MYISQANWSATTEMIQVILKFINDPSESFLMKALDCVIALREISVKEDEAERFNAFLRQIKADSASNPKCETFLKNWLLPKSLTLIRKSENDNGVEDAEADDVLLIESSSGTYHLQFLAVTEADTSQKEAEVIEDAEDLVLIIFFF